MDDLRVRPVVDADAPFLWQMLALAADAGRDRSSVEEVRADEAITRYLDGWGRPGDVGVVAERHGRLAGAAWYRTFSAAAPGYGFVDDATPELSIACRPGERGRGVGRALLDALLSCARADGVAAVSLSVSLDNVAARRLYQRCGFEPVGPAPADGSVTLVVRLR